MSNLENTTGLFVDKTWDTLDTSSASQSPDGRLSDTLDVVTEHLPVTLCATLAKTFATFASARHVCKLSTEGWRLAEVLGNKGEEKEVCVSRKQKAFWSRHVSAVSVQNVNFLPSRPCNILIWKLSIDANLTEQVVWLITQGYKCQLLPCEKWHSPFATYLQLSIVWPAHHLLRPCLDAAKERLLARSKSADQAKPDFSSLWAGLLVTSKRASLPLVLVLEPLCTWYASDVNFRFSISNPEKPELLGLYKLSVLS